MCGFTRKWFLAYLTSICFITSECYFLNRENKNLTRFKRQSTPGGTSCILPQHPQNGKWKVILAHGNFQPGDRVDSGTILEFNCNTQYTLVPSNLLVYCRGSSINVPQCLKRCSPIVSTETMTVKCTLNDVPVDCQTPYHGTQANIQCKSLYEDITLASRPNRLCFDGSWDYHLPMCEPVCGEITTDATPLVIEGREATKADYPWLIGVYNSTQIQICGGSMITPSITLSAAHCFEPTDPSKYFLAAGKYYRGYKDERDKNAQFSNVKEIKIHSDYSTDYYAFDIAILVLETPFVMTRFVLPVCVHYNTRYHESDLIGRKGIVAGWGFTTSVNQPSDVLKEVDVVYKTALTCELGEKFRKFFTLARDKMCAIATTPGSSACNGDSGGGLYFKSEDRNEKYGRYFIRGIVSLSARDNNTWGCDVTKPTLFTGVHYHAELIQSYANNNRIKNSNQLSPRPRVTNNEKIVVCFILIWARFRQGDGKYLPSDIDADLCTHITLGYAVLDQNTLTIKNWENNDKDFYRQVVAYKKKGIKVLIAIGGLSDSADGNKYSRLVNNPASRAKFIEVIIKFIEKYDFDGLDLVWEYPKCWHAHCSRGPDSDKRAFAQFVAELRAAFNPRGWLLSGAVAKSKNIIDAGYDVPSLSQNFDWIAVMCYDYHGHWDKKTGHVSPLYYSPGDDYDFLNINYTIHYWIKLGADPKKLVMGMPSFGPSFSLADVNEHGINARSNGPGEAGEFTRTGGSLAFYEICAKVKRPSWKVVRDPEGRISGVKPSSWKVVRDPESRIGSYAYNGNQWVSYDDIADIRRKSQLVNDWGLGGGMIWALDLDDFRNLCGCGKSPILRNMNNVLRNVPLDKQIENCT